jgi:hypothetical protein
MAKPAAQQPPYEDRAALDAVLGELAALPPLVTSGEVLSLKQQLVDAAAAQTAMQSRAMRAEAEVVLLERQYAELLSAKAEVVPLDANGVKYEQRLHDFKVIWRLEQPCTLLSAACRPLHVVRCLHVVYFVAQGNPAAEEALRRLRAELEANRARGGRAEEGRPRPTCPVACNTQQTTHNVQQTTSSVACCALSVACCTLFAAYSVLFAASSSQKSSRTTRTRSDRRSC